MPKSKSLTESFECDLCGILLSLDQKQTGAKYMCPRCGKVNILDDHPDAAASCKLIQTNVSVPAASGAEHVHFYCRICDTGLVGLLSNKGQQARCPACGAGTVIPGKSRVYPKPSATSGQDSQPSEKLEETVEETLDDPSLEGSYVAWMDNPQMQPIQGRLDLLETEDKEHLISPSALSPSKLLSRSSPIDEQERLRGSIQNDTDGRKRSNHRPQMPRFPILWGLWPMLIRYPLPLEWIGLSVVVVVETVLFRQTLVQASNGYNAFLAVVCVAAFSVIGLYFSMAISALGCAILTESSEGHDRLYDPPGPLFTEWLGDFASFGVAVSISLIPGWFLGQLGAEAMLSIGACAIIFFPVLLLSSLASGNPLSIFSSRLWGSLIWCPGPWLLFYLESFLLWSACLAGVLWLARSLPYITIIAPPIVLATLLLYFRVLGRLGWWLAELLPLDEEKLSDTGTVV